MDAVRPGASRGEEEGVAFAQQLLAAAAVQNGAGIDLGVHAIAEPAGQVRLDDAGDDVHRRTLRREDEVDAHGAGLLRDAGDALFHLAARHHHEIRQFVNDHHHEGQRLHHVRAVRPSWVWGAALEINDAAGLLDLEIELFEVPHAQQREAPIAVLHLRHGPLEHPARLFHVRHHRRPEVGDVFVDAQFHHLWIHQDELHFAGQRSHEDRTDHGVDAHALAAAGAAADEEVRHSAQIRYHGIPGNVLAHGQGQQR